MRKHTVTVGIAGILIALFTTRANAQSTQVTTDLSAIEAYKNGFVNDVMIAPLANGVSLYNYKLLENDGPGAGWSQKGTFLEPIHEGVLIRKQFVLDEVPVSSKTHVVFFMIKSKDAEGDPPYYLKVNGTDVAGVTASWHEPSWRWVEIPVATLKKGLNEIIIGCDAPKNAGYELLFAREDEYEGGGGKFTYGGNTALTSAGQIDPEQEADSPLLKKIAVGATSAKSVDGGRTWSVGKLGPGDSIVGEYTVRLHLERFESTGILASPPIDLWSTSENQVVVPQCSIQSLQMEANAFLPKETSVIWEIRTANTQDMHSTDWGAWRRVGEGGDFTSAIPASGHRYLQWRAVLSTENPLRTPVVHRVAIHRSINADTLTKGDYAIVSARNPVHRYPSFKIKYEDANHPELQLLKEKLKLLKLVEDTQGDFEKINRVRHLVSSLWKHELPSVEYPEWNANHILERREKFGAGGMCMQFSVVFMQALQALGYNVRHTNIFAHETVEVYVDELGKWVLVDPESVFDSYEYNTLTGIPLNVLEQHQFFLQELGFSARRPIDWTSPVPWAWRVEGIARVKQPLNFSTFTAHLNDPKNPPPQHILAGFVRFIPRSDFLSNPMPRPVSNGLQIEWPWNGYVNWYDSATPRKLQYALYSDREADFYPTLNQVQYSATHGAQEGEIDIQMITSTPNFESFEININGQGWQRAAAGFMWKLRPAALNTLEMRTINTVGVVGKPSSLNILWHYREPYKPLVKEENKS